MKIDAFHYIQLGTVYRYIDPHLINLISEFVWRIVLCNSQALFLVFAGV